MKLNLSPEFFKRMAEEPDLEGCPYCGALAGACDSYPNCPGGAQQGVTMTTTVKILIEGNKACEVKVEGNAGDAPVTVKPGSFTTKQIHGEQRVSVVEVGEFLS